jgi:thiol:disulfide interchange protein
MKSRFYIALLNLVLLTTGAFSQILKPAKWKFSVSKSELKIGDQFDLVLNATIDEDWYLYSSEFEDPDLGPIRTTIKINGDSFELVGPLKAVNPSKKYDDVWEGEVKYFKKNGQFTQTLKVLRSTNALSGQVDWQTCTDVDGRCINGKDNINIPLKILAGSTAKKKSETLVEGDNVKLTPEIKQEEIALPDEVGNEEPEIKPILDQKNLELREGKSNFKEIEEEAANTPIEESTSLIKFLILAFGAGLASIFMPCIYPIMPITVSYFTKQKDGKIKAFFYGLCIVVIFALMGLVTMAFGAPFLNFLSTHWAPNTIFFIIFILFGISLLGAFEIVLPHETVNKIDSMSDRGGYIGIFFMALTLVVVSFSCTVPFVGSLLILSAGGEVLRPLYGMIAFGLPFAAVFTLLAMFPQFLKNLPKSGGWLNELKVVFGLLEFGLALKFLSNIDLAYHFNLLHRNIFLVVWIVISAIIVLYILGFMRMSKDSKVEKFGFVRVFFALFFGLFTLYMIPGVTGKPLAALSGILPPMPVGEIGDQIVLEEGMKQLPHNLVGFSKYKDALAYAKREGKPVLIDFTGYACANCRKMEEFVWPKEGVLEQLKNDFVIASLYVDDKQELPASEHYVSSYDNELKTSVGEQNMDLEITKFNNNAQPYYAIVNANGDVLNGPLGYSSKEEFAEFLEIGKSKFDAR